MADNQDKLRHDRVAQHASVQRERARSSQTPVDSNLVDMETSTFWDHTFPHSSSRRRQKPPHNSPGASLVHVEAPQAAPQAP